MHMIDWFMPMLKDLVTELAPVAFIIWAVGFGLSAFIHYATGSKSRNGGF